MGPQLCKPTSPEQISSYLGKIPFLLNMDQICLNPTPDLFPGKLLQGPAPAMVPQASEKQMTAGLFVPIAKVDQADVCQSLWSDWACQNRRLRPRQRMCKERFGGQGSQREHSRAPKSVPELQGHAAGCAAIKVRAPAKGKEVTEGG